MLDNLRCDSRENLYPSGVRHQAERKRKAGGEGNYGTHFVCVCLQDGEHDDGHKRQQRCRDGSEDVDSRG